MKNRLRVLRAEREWSQADLAGRLKVSRQTVNAIETGKYGFFDSFNPSFRDTHVSLRSGSVDGRLGWVDNDYLSDNQGPILGMIANCKTGIIWNATRKVPNLVRGLKRAGFTGGWLNGA